MNNDRSPICANIRKAPDWEVPHGRIENSGGPRTNKPKRRRIWKRDPWTIAWIIQPMYMAVWPPRVLCPSMGFFLLLLTYCLLFCFIWDFMLFV